MIQIFQSLFPFENKPSNQLGDIRIEEIEEDDNIEVETFVKQIFQVDISWEHFKIKKGKDKRVIKMKKAKGITTPKLGFKGGSNPLLTLNFFHPQVNLLSVM